MDGSYRHVSQFITGGGEFESTESGQVTELEVIYLLIPISLLLVGVIIYFLFWAIRSGQFDDMDGAGFQILMDDDDHV